MQILEKAHSLETNNDIESVFDIVLETIQNSKHEKIILDITHGMRHQPLMAAFGATLSKIYSQADIRILFAKEIVPHKEYHYVYLDSYGDIGFNAILLNSFIKTLSVPEIPHNNKLLSSLQVFTNALHTNALHTLLKSSLPNALLSLKEFKRDPLYHPLENLIDEVEIILQEFNALKKMQEEYKKYYGIAQIMFQKKYYLISITYAFEALPKYIINKFQKNGILKDKKDFSEYDIAQAIQQFVLSKISKPEIFAYDKACLYYDTYQDDFKKLKNIWETLKEIRNNLVHISQDFNTKDIEQTLGSSYDTFKELCIEKDSFGDCDMSILCNLDNLASKIQKYFNDRYSHKFSEDFFKILKFVKQHVEEGKSFSVSKYEQEKIQNDEKAQKILNLLYKHRDSKYLTKEQGKEFEAILRGV